MKNSIKLMLILAICALQFSCSTDDDTITDNSHLLIGDWLENDLDENTEYIIHFSSEETVENHSYISSKIIYEEGTISGGFPFRWSVNDDLLTITMSVNSETSITTFEITADGKLILADFSEFEFIKQ